MIVGLGATPVAVAVALAAGGRSSYMIAVMAAESGGGVCGTVICFPLW